MKIARYRILVALLFCLLISIPISAKEIPKKSLTVFVGIPPLAYFVKQIGGPLVTVETLLEPGHSPATYDPTPQQMVRLAEADVLFTVGVPFEERLLKKISSGLTHVRVVDTRQGIQLQPISSNDKHSSHGRMDPHIWLDPKLAAVQAATICKTLTDVAPSYTITFQRGLLKLRQQLDSIDTEIQMLLAPVQGKRIYVFHPSFGYFCRAYGLQQVAIEVNGKEPSARELTRIMESTRNHDVKTLFVQPQFAKKTARAIAENIGAKIEVLDPLSPDYIRNLGDIAKKIAKSFDNAR